MRSGLERLARDAGSRRHEGRWLPFVSLTGRHHVLSILFGLVLPSGANRIIMPKVPSNGDFCIILDPSLNAIFASPGETTYMGV